MQLSRGWDEICSVFTPETMPNARGWVIGGVVEERTLGKTLLETDAQRKGITEHRGGVMKKHFSPARHDTVL